MPFSLTLESDVTRVVPLSMRVAPVVVVREFVWCCDVRDDMCEF